MNLEILLNGEVFYKKSLATTTVHPENTATAVATEFLSTMGSLVEGLNNTAWNINSLPEEILINIFGYLSQNELGRIARVCRIWHLLTKSSVLWKKVNVKFSPSHGSQSTIAKHFVNLLPPCVICIKLDFTRRRYWTEFLHFEEFCVKLQESCPHLKILILIWAKLSISLPSVIDVCTQFLQKLQVLAFRNSEFANCPVKRECTGPSKIEILDLSGSSLGHFNKPLFSKMMHLKQLYLTDTNVDYSWFEDDISLLKQLEVLDVGETWIDSRTFQAIRNHALSLKKLYLCLTNLEDNDFIFDNSVFPKLETICLRYFNDGTSDSVVSLIQSCQSLQNVYVDKDLAASYTEHPFAIVNKCKLGIVKIIDCYYSHRNDNYLREYMI